LKITILTPQHFQTTQWSGGSTTQLYIFPPTATYTERNFELRLSTAKVEAEESTFTSLPGIDRKLMILEGAITITHQDKYTKHLTPFQVDEFSGDWKTTAIGTCTDFNVMTKGKQQSELYHIAMGSSSSYTLKPKAECKKLFLYANSGIVQLQLINENYTLKTGNLMVIEDFSVSSIAINDDMGFGVVVLEMY
jgi:environmental stress-induced protein Ves